MVNVLGDGWLFLTNCFIMIDPVLTGSGPFTNLLSVPVLPSCLYPHQTTFITFQNASTDFLGKPLGGTGLFLATSD